MTHVFDPDVVHECALACLGKPKPAMFDAFAMAMEGRYPDRLDLDQPWIFSNAGGAMIQMKLYYASIFEYIMIWGTPIGSEGHSGRHAVGFWDTVIDGEMWYYGEGQFEKRVYGPADEVFSTLDFATAAQTLSIYATLVGHHLSRPHPDGSPPSPMRRRLGALLGTAGTSVTRRVRPPEPDDTIPSDVPRGA